MELNIYSMIGFIFIPYFVGALLMLVGNLALTWINKKPIDMDIRDFKSLIKTWVVGAIVCAIIYWLRKGGQL